MGSVQHATFKGLAITPLYKDDFEDVSLLHFEADSNMQISANGGAELLVLEGDISEQTDVLVKHSWLRLPINSELNITAGKQGAKVWLKLGHLTDVDKQIERVQNA